MRTTQRREDVLKRIQVASRRLFLSNELCERCDEDATLQQCIFLMEVLEAEVEVREANKIRTLIKRANFPAPKTLDGYNFSKVTMPGTLSIEALKDLSFIPEHQNIVLFGPVGTGKTHLATAIGTAACEKGMKVRFYTVGDLVMRLSVGMKDLSLPKLKKELNSLDLLILDEWGYIPVDREGAQLLFQVISDCYENTSVILTTNIEFGKWGSVFTDNQMVAAIIDRLVHHGHMIIFTGKSYRMEHALMGGREAS